MKFVVMAAVIFSSCLTLFYSLLVFDWKDRLKRSRNQQKADPAPAAAPEPEWEPEM